MTSKFLAATVSGLAALAVASGAFAQAAAPAAKPPAPPAITHGPAIPGLCVFSANAVNDTSATGKALDARLEALQKQASAPLEARGKSLQDRITAYNAQKAPFPPTREKQGNDLKFEQEQLQRDSVHAQIEMQATIENATRLYNAELQPAAIAAYQQKQCSVLLSEGSASIFAPSMDISPQISAALDARGKATTFSALERTKLTQEQVAEIVQRLQQRR
jgi:outer membrane protein